MRQDLLIVNTTSSLPLPTCYHLPFPSDLQAGRKVFPTKMSTAPFPAPTSYPWPPLLPAPSNHLQAGRKVVPTESGITQSFPPSFPILLSIPCTPSTGPFPSPPPPAPALPTRRQATRSSLPSWASPNPPLPPFLFSSLYPAPHHTPLLLTPSPSPSPYSLADWPQKSFERPGGNSHQVEHCPLPCPPHPLITSTHPWPPLLPSPFNHPRAGFKVVPPSWASLPSPPPHPMITSSHPWPPLLPSPFNHPQAGCKIAPTGLGTTCRSPSPSSLPSPSPPLFA